MDIHEESEFVDAIRSGDPVAEGAFCDRFAPRVLLLVRGKRVPRSDCDALVQDILAVALQQIRGSQYRAEARLGTWVYAIATRKVVDYWRTSRTAKRLVSLNEALTEIVPCRIDYQPEEVIAVQETLARLAPEDRLVLWLHDAEGATLEEIGRRIDRKKSAVADRLAQARERFRRAFEVGGGRNHPGPRLKD